MDFHAVVVCREHGAEDLKSFHSQTEVLNYINNFTEDAEKVFRDVIPGERTTNMVEFTGVTPDGNTHELFMSWARHVEGDVTICDEARNAMAAIKTMEQMMRSLLGGKGGENPFDAQQENALGSADEGFDFSSLEDFLRGPDANA